MHQNSVFILINVELFNINKLSMLHFFNKNFFNTLAFIWMSGLQSFPNYYNNIPFPCCKVHVWNTAEVTAGSEIQSEAPFCSVIGYFDHCYILL